MSNTLDGRSLEGQVAIVTGAARGRRVDILVNNAAQPPKLIDTDAETYDRIYRVVAGLPRRQLHHGGRGGGRRGHVDLMRCRRGQ
ncbi:MAG: hypothetical protein OEY70_18055 [Acidimicrobiia bacterium]|nr:hypothetical protein [Acidimicrobiia bacterium]